MTGIITLLDQPRTLDALGQAADAIIYFYYTETTSLAPVYSDEDLNIPAVNPVELAAGEIFPDIYLDPAITYRRRIVYGDGTIHDVDPLTIGTGLGGQNIIVDNDPNYSGTGTATSGAPRVFFGTLTPSGDDSALCLGREVIGNALFSHAVRDESEFTSTGDSAYTSFDASVTYKSNGSLKYNHGYGYQWRSLMSAANGIDLYSGFLSFPRQSAGNIDRLFHFHAQGFTKTGGTTGSHVGFYCAPLSGGTGENYAFFAEGDNPSFFGGYVQLNTKDIIGIRESKQQAGHFSGTINSYNVAGGVFVGGQVTGAGYAAVRAYNDNVGTSRGLSLNDTGGQVLIGSGIPVTGAALEVAGSITSTTTVRTIPTTVTSLPAAATAGAGARAFVTDSSVVAAANFGNIVAGSGANGVPVYSDGTNWRIG